jgi:hypothetical protein
MQIPLYRLPPNLRESPAVMRSDLTPIIAAARGVREENLVRLNTVSNLMRLPWICQFIIALSLSLASVSAQPSGNADHPTVALVNQYFKHVVDEDWKAAAAMLSPTSLDRKKQKALDVVKRAPTMTAEAEMLEQLGVKELKELEAMSPMDFYAAERIGVSRKDERSDAIRKQKQDSLKVDVLGVIPEQAGSIVHLAVRTSQAVLDKKIEELIFISFQQDADDKKKWFIVPDMQMPVTTALEGAAAPAPATVTK